MALLTRFFLSLGAAALLRQAFAQSLQYKPQTVELDLVFPRNETYSSLEKFPLLWGLQNAQSAWVMGMMFSWELQQLDLAYERPLEGGVFPNRGYSGPGTTSIYTQSGIAPGDPYFLYYFPSDLHNFTEGHWKLSWKFGFHTNCTHHSEETNDHFEQQEPKELIFRVAQSGKLVDLLSLGNSTCSDQSITFHIVDWVRALWTSSDNCPILSPTAPKAKPCALSFNETLIDEMNAGAETGCSSATVTVNQNWCKRSSATNSVSLGVKTLLFAFSLSLMSLQWV